MKCTSCGAELSEGIKFCPECGNKVELLQKRFCRECGCEYTEGTKFCPACGAKTEIDFERITQDSPKVGQAEEYHDPSDNEPRKYGTTFPSNSNEVSEQASAFAGKIREKATQLTGKMSEVFSSLNQNSKFAAKTSDENPPKEQKKKIALIAAAVLALIVCFSLLGSMNSNADGKSKSSASDNEKIEVVDVVDKSYPDALAALQGAGFTNIVSNVESTDGASWLVIDQSIAAGKMIRAGDKIELTCAKQCKLYLDISSEYNLFLNTYDIAIFLDDSEIGSVSNGEEFTYLADVLSGEHKLVFSKTGNTTPKATKKITVSDDLTYSCELTHSGSSISMKNEKTEDNIQGSALKVTDVTGMVLSEAMSTLENIGFSNLREEPYGKIWDKNNWIVTNQNLAAGTVADKNEYIQLDCISLDDYFSSTYVGKNIGEIQEHAEKNGFYVKFENSSYDDIDAEVAAMDDAAKQEWIAIDAWQYGGADKTAKVTVKSANESDEPTESTAGKSTPEEEKNDTKTVYYSTNSTDTVKNGDSGVYAYKSIGGQYDVYIIIDFDEDYVYWFSDGNGDTSCDRIMIQSGTLNDVMTVTYHFDDGPVSYGMCFSWKNQPDHLIVQTEQGYEVDFYPTSLSQAISVRNTKTIHDF